MHRWQGLTVASDEEGLPPFAPAERPPSRGRTFAELPALALAALVIAFLVKTFLAQAFFIPSDSMLPTLEPGDRVVVSRTAFRIHEPNRGDVVVFPKPGVEPEHPALPARVVDEVLESTGLAKPDEIELIKRVIGLPGETIEAHDGRVHIDGRPLVEPYLPEGTVQTDFAPISIPDDFVFMMGDNRSNSSDSRFFGPVPIDSLVGRAMAVVWPPGHAQFL